MPFTHMPKYTCSDFALGRIYLYASNYGYYFHERRKKTHRKMSILKNSLEINL